MKKAALILCALLISVPSFAGTNFQELSTTFSQGTPIKVNEMMMVGRCYDRFSNDIQPGGFDIRSNSKTSKFDLALFSESGKAADFYDLMTFNDIKNLYGDRLYYYFMTITQKYTGSVIELRQTSKGIMSAVGSVQVNDYCLYTKRLR